MVLFTFLFTNCFQGHHGGFSMPTTPTPMDNNIRRAVPAHVVQYENHPGVPGQRKIPGLSGNPGNPGNGNIRGSMIPTRMRPKSLTVAIHTVEFEKGHGRKGLGFSVVGGIDSPKGSIGNTFLSNEVMR